MEQVLAFDIWVLSIAVSCCAGWLLSDLNKEVRQGARGSLRASNSDADCELDDLFSLSKPPKVAPDASSFDVASAEDELSAVRDEACAQPRPILRQVVNAATDGEPQPLTLPASATRQCRRSSFEGMPPVDQIRDQAKAIRTDARVWDSPNVAEKLAEFMRCADRKSVDTLIHYRKAIAEMQRFNASGSYVHQSEQSTGEGTSQKTAQTCNANAAQSADIAMLLPRYAGVGGS